jgi:hypothetical protein
MNTIWEQAMNVSLAIQERYNEVVVKYAAEYGDQNVTAYGGKFQFTVVVTPWGRFEISIDDAYGTEAPAVIVEAWDQDEIGLWRDIIES